MVNFNYVKGEYITRKLEDKTLHNFRPKNFTQEQV